MIKMLRVSTSLEYDLYGLATSQGFVTVGRDMSSIIRLDSPEVPCLLSRKHGKFMVRPNGTVHLVDLSSTNGTFIAREGQRLRRLSIGTTWELLDGDAVSFGGPGLISVGQRRVANPFLFKYIVAATSQSTEEPAPAPPPPLANTKKKKKKKRRTKMLNDVTDVMLSQFTCAICQDWMLGCHAMSCGHMFCGHCLAKWLDLRQACPTCRKPISSVPIRCFQIDNAINDLLEKGVNILSPSSKHEREQKHRAWVVASANATQNWDRTHEDRRSNALRVANDNNNYLAIDRSILQNGDSIITTHHT